MLGGQPPHSRKRTDRQKSCSPSGAAAASSSPRFGPGRGMIAARSAWVVARTRSVWFRTHSKARQTPNSSQQSRHSLHSQRQQYSGLATGFAQREHSSIAVKSTPQVRTLLKLSQVRGDWRTLRARLPIGEDLKR